MFTIFLAVLTVTVSQSSAINWNGNEASGCKFVGKDLSNVDTNREDCRAQCAMCEDCTHFTWTKFNNGTCWLKKDGASRSDAIESCDKSSLCGIMDVDCSDDDNDNEPLNEWNLADLTDYESYPEPGSDECIIYNGCKWTGQFAFVSGKQTESWVKEHNIIAVHSKDAPKYKLKTLRLRQGSRQIDAVVYDLCSDDDCNGCCTEHSKRTGFLIDIEKYTKERFGSGNGTVQWKCLDC